MNCSAGHDVPETSDVTVIGVVVPTSVRGRICCGVIANAPAGAVAICVLEGAVTMPRSEPHATSDDAPSIAAATATNGLPFLTTHSSGKRRPCATGAAREFTSRATAQLYGPAL